jgi:glycyl-tRNA synthetase
MTAPNEPAPQGNAPGTPLTKTMDNIVALARRRAFIWQSSEIYGGINGFWDYGPMGAALKKNLKDAWRKDIILCPAAGPDGKTLDVVEVDCTIIMHPKVWIASGHAAGFNDPMQTCKQCKKLPRADHVAAILRESDWARSLWAELEGLAIPSDEAQRKAENWSKKRGTKLAPGLPFVRGEATTFNQFILTSISTVMTNPLYSQTLHVCPYCGGDLTEPRAFNLMFESHAGAIKDEDNKVWLRPETAQGIFTQFWNVVDTSRVKVPFGIAQQGKAFRNEVTPRNFTFRSREFEQMEIEFFITHPDALKPGELTPKDWYEFWYKSRYQWWQDVGLAGDNLQLRHHDKDELSHYAKEGAGVCDVEYRFPFTAPGFGELEGIAHRADFDLKAHARYANTGADGKVNEDKANKLRYFDQARNTRYFPHVIEPSAGADRGTLALLCEAFTPDPSRPSGVYMKFKPRMAPIKAGLFPLVNKDGMPEIAEKLHKELRGKYAIEFDEKQTIGKRYARMDEVGTPYCFTIDGDTVKDQTVTVRERDTLKQERINIGNVGAYLAEKIGE